MRGLVALLCCLCLLTTSFCVRHPARTLPKVANQDHNRYVVRLKEGKDVRHVHDTLASEAELKGHTFRRTMESRKRNTMVVEMDLTALDMVKTHDDVEVVVKDIRLDPPQGNPDVVMTPTDDVPWHLDRINQRALPLDGAFSFGNKCCRGRDVNIYVIDSGIRDTHVDFQRNGVSRVVHLEDIIGGAGFGTDCLGHGTAVASVAAGGSYGVSNQASLFDVRIFNCVDGTYLSHLEYAITAILDSGSPPGIIVMSVTAFAPAYDDEYVPWITSFNALATQAVNAGHILVTGAGNDADFAEYYLPASSGFVITVGASSKKDKICGFSNIGYAVDLYAPGYALPSASHTGDTEVVLRSGTSFSAPLVAGLCASLLGVNDTLNHSAMLDKILEDATDGALINVEAWTESVNLLAYGTPLLHNC
ncbi:uncharacterized protein LOC100378931 [Saccoglossus kowalevskii]|uniref:Cuticle-degrading protease-like n=1 Tax=Saccoglossus kowalevskii TaxID=10224 RepID=A0ABM0MUB8_SACKO|nr:PREDICTED: cuticle-degrading protease-like [Saccoglossus kowalevskii]